MAAAILVRRHGDSGTNLWLLTVVWPQRTRGFKLQLLTVKRRTTTITQSSTRRIAIMGRANEIPVCEQIEFLEREVVCLLTSSQSTSAKICQPTGHANTTCRSGISIPGCVASGRRRPQAKAVLSGIRRHRPSCLHSRIRPVDPRRPRTSPHRRAYLVDPS